MESQKLLIFLKFRLTLHKEGHHALECDSSDLVDNVDTDDVLSQDFEVEVPPADVDQGEEAVEKLENEAFENEGVLVVALVLVVLPIGAPSGHFPENGVQNHRQHNLKHSRDESHISVCIKYSTFLRQRCQPWNYELVILGPNSDHTSDIIRSYQVNNNESEEWKENERVLDVSHVAARGAVVPFLDLSDRVVFWLSVEFMSDLLLFMSLTRIIPDNF